MFALLFLNITPSGTITAALPPGFNSFKNKSILEKFEDIEILRFLEFDYKIFMYECKSGSLAVDTPQDVAKVEKILIKNENF